MSHTERRVVRGYALMLPVLASMLTTYASPIFGQEPEMFLTETPTVEASFPGPAEPVDHDPTLHSAANDGVWVSEAQYRDRISRGLEEAGCTGVSASLFDRVQTDDPEYGLISIIGKAPWGRDHVQLASDLDLITLDATVAHECAHVLQYRAYDANLVAMARDMEAVYGSSGPNGNEQNADCVAAALGARWGLAYTGDCTGERGEAAEAILDGRRIR